MTLANGIENRVAGFIWLGTGFIGAWWINAQSEQVRREVGGWWRYFFGPEPGAEARAKVVNVQRRLWTFAGVWFAMYVVLALLF